MAPTHLRQGCGSEAGILLPADRMLLIVKKKMALGKINTFHILISDRAQEAGPKFDLYKIMYSIEIL